MQMADTIRTNERTNERTGRNYGIDALRILAAFMVLVLHILGQGGVLRSLPTLSVNHCVAWALEIASFCAVDCFALISGYVGYGKKQKYSNIFYLTLQMLFYSLLTLIAFGCMMPEIVGIKDIIKSSFPFVYRISWYFRAYFGMFFFIPFLNFLLSKMDKRQSLHLTAAVFIIFSVLPTLFHTDAYNTEYGYSLIWLSLLYLLGGIFRKYHLQKYITVQNAFLGYLVSIALTFLSMIILEAGTSLVLGKIKGGGFFIQYTSPTILFSAVFLFAFFSQLNINNHWQRVISFFAPLAFGVIISHGTPLIWQYVIPDLFIAYAQWNPFAMTLAVLGTAFVIWFVCSMIDKLRLAIFNALKIKEKCVKLETYLRTKIEPVMDKLAVQES